MSTKHFFTLVAILFSLGLGNLRAMAQNPPTPISISINSGGSFGNIPRIPAVIPISGFVLGNSIYLHFSADFGDVTVCLEEVSGGVIINNVVLDSSEDPVIIPFDGSPGVYTITFTFENGNSYIGRFEIL